MKSYCYYSESELIDLLQSDNRAAFAEIYNRYWQLMIDTAYQRLKSVEAAEEVVQDVFINLFLRKEIKLKSTLEAYLKTALKYKVYNVYRSQQVHYNHLGAIIKENHIDPVMPDAVLETKELKAMILLAADKMPDKCREVFLLSRFENLSQQDIAVRMDISVSTVKKHITKAMRIVRTEFQGYQFNLLAVCLFIFTSRLHTLTI